MKQTKVLAREDAVAQFKLVLSDPSLSDAERCERIDHLIRCVVEVFETHPSRMPNEVSFFLQSALQHVTGDLWEGTSGTVRAHIINLLPEYLLLTLGETTLIRPADVENYFRANGAPDMGIGAGWDVFFNLLENQPYESWYVRAIARSQGIPDSTPIEWVKEILKAG